MGESRLARAELEARLRAELVTRELHAPGKPRVLHAELLARQNYAAIPCRIGLLKTLLGQPDEARKSFVEAADLCEPVAFESPPDLQTYGVALEAAILSGDRVRANRIAARRGAVAWEDRFLRDRKAYAYGLPCLVTGDRDGASPHIETARRVAPKKAWYTGLGALMGAVSSLDQASMGTALEAVLKDHHARACRRSQIWNSIWSFVCVPATVLAILARWSELDIPGTIPSRRAVLKNLLIYGLAEFEGRPLEKGATFDLEVDYLPPALVP